MRVIILCKTELENIYLYNNNNKKKKKKKKTAFLFKRLSMALQKGNAVSFQNTMSLNEAPLQPLTLCFYLSIFITAAFKIIIFVMCWEQIRLVNSGFALRMTDVNQEDIGFYTCIVSNELGQLNWTRKLDVIGLSSLSVFLLRLLFCFIAQRAFRCDICRC